MHYLKDNIKIYVYAMPVLDSRMYIVINDQDEKEALVIDPLKSKEAISIIQKLEQVTILLTHSHYDHISGVNWFREMVDCTVFCSDICAENIADENMNLSAFATGLIVDKTEHEKNLCMEFFELDYKCYADKIFSKETEFRFGSFDIEIIHTPGHSDCSQCISLKSHHEEGLTQIVFTGDSFVNGYEVITRLPGGSKRKYMKVTRPFLDSLDEETIIMPGHGDWGSKGEIYIC